MLSCQVSAEYNVLLARTDKYQPFCTTDNACSTDECHVLLEMLVAAAGRHAIATEPNHPSHLAYLCHSGAAWIIRIMQHPDHDPNARLTWHDLTNRMYLPALICAWLLLLHLQPINQEFQLVA